MRLHLRKGRELATVVAKLWFKKQAKTLIGVAACLVGAAFVAAQTLPTLTSAPAQKTAATAQASAAPDVLERETPRGTVGGFVRAAQNENYEVAIQYFQPTTKGHRVEDTAEEQELAKHLLAVLNARFPTNTYDSISRDPQPIGDDGLPHDQLTIVPTRNLTETFPLYLVRLDQGHGSKLWFISRQTLDQVPEAYDSLRFPQIEKRLPRFLVRVRPLGMPLWQWIAIVLFAPVALVLGRVIAFVSYAVWQWVRRKRGLSTLPREKLLHFGPGTVLVATIIHYNFVYIIGASLLYRQYYRQVIWVFLFCAFYWAVTRVTHRVSRDISQQLTDRGLLAERSLVSLARRVLDVSIFIFLALTLLSGMFNVNVSAALAGLGIGGLAIGLGAQKTFENLLGGISILTDKAIVVGDSCKIGDQTGVVEDIGLRSTKLRTEYRTLVSIPNGTVATATLENFRPRDKILSKQSIRLRYDLLPDHVRHVLGEIRDVLTRHPKVEQGTARVRLLKFGDNGLEVEIYAYILERDFSEFLATQEDLMLKVMDVLERTGAAVAIPSQTTLVTKDSWVDPAKAAAAKEAVEKSRPASPGTGQS